MNDQKPHLSASQLESLCRCPEAWRRRYIENDKIPPAMAMLQGTAVHAGAAINFRQKIESHVDLPASEIIDASIAAFEEATHAGYSLTAEETSIGATRVIGDMKDETARLASAMATEVAPLYQPTLVEEPFRIELRNSPRDLIGFIDLADVERQVRDFKTANKKKTQAEADNSTQLTIYAAAHRVLTGEPAANVGLEVLVKGQTIQRQILTSDRGPADFQALAHRTNAALAVIDAGVFLPAVAGAWWCSPTWCGFFSSCKFVNSERIAKAGGAEVVARSARKPRAKKTKEKAAPPAPIDPQKPLALDPLPGGTARSKHFRSVKDRLLAETTKPKCHWCNRPVSANSAKIDFVTPLSDGGQNVFENLCLSCTACSRDRVGQSAHATNGATK